MTRPQYTHLADEAPMRQRFYSCAATNASRAVTEGWFATLATAVGLSRDCRRDRVATASMSLPLLSGADPCRRGGACCRISRSG